MACSLPPFPLHRHDFRRSVVDGVFSHMRSIDEKSRRDCDIRLANNMHGALGQGSVWTSFFERCASVKPQCCAAHTNKPEAVEEA